MSEFNQVKEADTPKDEALMGAYAKANLVFDEEDEIEELVAGHFGVTVEYVRSGSRRGALSNEVDARIKSLYKEAGWVYTEK